MGNPQINSGQLTLGNKKPSQLLAEMRIIATSVNISDECLRTIWLQKLPQKIQTILSKCGEEMGIDVMTVLADAISAEFPIDNSTSDSLNAASASSSNQARTSTASLTQNIGENSRTALAEISAVKNETTTSGNSGNGNDNNADNEAQRKCSIDGCTNSKRTKTTESPSQVAIVDCCICFADLDQTHPTANEIIITTACGHLCHQNCLNIWLKLQPTCPQCRTHVNRSDLRRIYFISHKTDILDTTVVQNLLSEKLDKELQIQSLETKLNAAEKEIEKKNLILRGSTRSSIPRRTAVNLSRNDSNGSLNNHNLSSTRFQPLLGPKHTNLDIDHGTLERYDYIRSRAGREPILLSKCTRCRLCHPGQRCGLF